MKKDRFKTEFVLHVAWLLMLLAAPDAIAQNDALNGTSSVEGVVCDASKHPLMEVKVLLEDQVEGRNLFTQTDSAGHFHFNKLPASTYIVRAKKPGYLDAAEGPFALGRAEAKSLSLQLSDASTPTSKSAAQSMEYSDEPQFTVAGVSDPSNVGGHGSNVTMPTKEALAKETASLGASPESENPATKVAGVEFPKVSATDFAENLRVGKELLQAGRAKQAVAYLRQASQLKPENYDAAYGLALALQRSGDTKSAEQSVNILLARADRAELHALLGEVKESEGQPLEAVREFQRAAEMDPSEEHLFLWGAELLLHHAYEPAAEVFAKGHRLHPKSVRILVGMGAAAYGQDLNEQAARWLLQASELDPGDPRPYESLGKVQEVAKSEPKEWVEAFERFVRLQPENPQAHYYYAVALEKERRGEVDYAARESHLMKAIEIDAKFGDAYLKLGVLYSEKREFPKAIEALRKAIEYTPMPDEAHLRLAQVYRQMGEAEKARRESLLYNEVSAKKKEELERERKELGQFIFTVREENAPQEQPATKP
jgi:tetratricopeptide (TPR) repeat protein